jgi:hypothetical protein
MLLMNSIKALSTVGLLAVFTVAGAQPIDRKAVVRRQTIRMDKADPLSSLSVGNGGFSFTADVTGLQSFPDDYAGGVPLGTESGWGWHSFPNNKGYRLEEAFKDYPFNNRERAYAVQWKEAGRNRDAADYLRANPHRLQLGNIGFELVKKDGSLATLKDLSGIRQVLDMWTGRLHSRFTLEGTGVEVVTYGHPGQDAVSVQVRSPLLKQGRLRIRVRFPYPTGQWADNGNNWKEDLLHRSAIIRQGGQEAVLQHVLDSTRYYTALRWSGAAVVKEAGPHYFVVEPQITAKRPTIFELTVRFTPEDSKLPVPSFAVTAVESIREWGRFWSRGGIIDLSGSTDPRASELERRVITSLYLTRIQCAGDQPPQETGLTYNSWYGRPHLEMHWWHGVHFALWGRTDLLEKSLGWYARAAATAYGIAGRQGYEGLRWQKMTDPEGRETPSSVGAFLIWQQPHFIYLAELCYRAHPGPGTLEKYKDLVFATADFMASYACYDSIRHRYVLGKGLIPAQECYHPEDTYNPSFELAYWYWALSTARLWRERLKLGPEKKWEAVLKELSPLPVQGDRYLFAESAADSYTNPVYRTDHPAVLCALGMLPVLPLTDTARMHATFDWVWDNWDWGHTWGWDFPMVAMTAVRLGLPERAIAALMKPVSKNVWLISGHNYQDGRLRVYLPGNGALLSAVALMCTGYKGSGPLPGWPRDGRWKVRYEGLRQMP